MIETDQKMMTELSLGHVKAELRVEINGCLFTRKVPIPEPYWEEAARRMRSDPTPDGARHCLNRCFLPFYGWVRTQTELFLEQVTCAYRIAHPHETVYVPPFEEAIPVHPHVPTAPHWFESLLEQEA